MPMQGHKGMKVLYFCPVDWRWIKQRPQFLAEQLQHYCDLKALYPWKNRRKGLQSGEIPTVDIQPYFTLPELGGRVGWLKSCNRIWVRAQVARVLRKEKPDMLWLTMPWQVDFLPKGLNCRIVYDCMDDYEAISMQQEEREKTLRQEAELIARAEMIFVSSDHLLHLLMRRHGVSEGRLYLLRNGYSSSWVRAAENAKTPDSLLRIAYFGTIGRWFDFGILLQSLDVFPNLEYQLYGPLENGVSVPNHARLHVCGVVKHDRIPEKASVVDAVIMPFLPTDVVQSVDPVKLYEYIFLDKPIVCVRYPEIERFAPYVEFYETKDQFNAAIQRLFDHREPKYTRRQADIFLEKNTWFVRGKCAAERMGLITTEE